MFWFTVKNKLLLFWAVLKKHWSLVVLVVVGLVMGALVAMGVFKNNKRYEELMSMYNDRLALREQEVRQINEARQKEIERREQIEKTYQETIERINRDHAEQIGKLTAAKEQEVRRIVAETNDDPALMASRINELFGITVVQQ
jgi:thiamine biosynthesis lipoprotein ApbE